MKTLRPVRGTHDLLPEDARKARHVVDTGRSVAGKYGYDELVTPIFEYSDVFARTLGETSDIVTKEMYTFEDKGGDMLTLRPEGTAGVVRAFLSGGLQQSLPLRYFYAGPMFRYERPQKGRLRQFHQIGAELLGVPDPVGDIEVIALGASILGALGLQDSILLELNTLGNHASRARYREVLVEYFSDHVESLSEESRTRLERNPLRILDSKNRGDRAVVAEAPSFADSLDTVSREFFAEVCSGLDALKIPYQLNTRLVRGLDYYCHTAFEFTTDRLGAQSAVLAGGRYDGLVETMGGPPTAGVGWASGVERLSMLAHGSPSVQRPVVVIPIDRMDVTRAMGVAEHLRDAGFRVEMEHRGKLRQRMKRANDRNARLAILIGEDERAQDAVKLRDLDSGCEDLVGFSDLVSRLKSGVGPNPINRSAA